MSSLPPLPGDRQAPKPPAENAFVKRIRRQVVGRIREYFIAAAPGFEELVRDELSAFLPGLPEIRAVEGGVEFRGRLQDCFIANLNLRTANRILLRIGRFRAENFRRLTQELLSIPWELFLFRGEAPSVSVASRHSRLYHKGAVADCIREVLEARLPGCTPQPGEDTAGKITQQLFVRIAEDRVSLSIDSSGELLHKRGIKTDVGDAPLRETIAAAALMLAGYTCAEPLVDPMCGSGTFSLEAAMMAGRIPAGWFRKFAFMGWPSFQERRWAHLRADAEKRMHRLSEPVIFASDRDASACRGLESLAKSCAMGDAIDVSCRDFFGFSPGAITRKKGLVAINPPYGLRLGTPKESERLFPEVCRKLKKDYPGWKVALFAPTMDRLDKLPFSLARRIVHHGGLQVILLTGTIE